MVHFTQHCFVVILSVTHFLNLVSSLPIVATNVAVSNGSDIFGYLSWQYPHVPASLITNFQIIHQSEDETEYEQTYVNAAGNVLMKIISRNVRYNVAVRAVSGSLLGPFANASLRYTDDGILIGMLSLYGTCCIINQNCVLIGPSANVSHVTQSGSGNFTATVTWPTVDSLPLGSGNAMYRVYYVRNKDCLLTLTVDGGKGHFVDVNDSSTVLFDLLPNSLYSICVTPTLPFSPPLKTVVVTPQTGLLRLYY